MAQPLTAVEIAQVEVDTALAVLHPKAAGLGSILNLDLEPSALVECEPASGKVERRLMLLHTLTMAATALLADGYPAVPTHAVPASVLATLERAATDSAHHEALTLFVAQPDAL